VPLDPVTRAQLAMIVMAIVFLGGALRSGETWPRWAAIGLLVVALLLRAVKRRVSPDD
jgi:hypothetical protein